MFRLVALTFFLALITRSLAAQLPPTQKLSSEDDREFRGELDRLRALLLTANDQAEIELQIAKTYAAGGQYGEAIRGLRKVVADDLGFDPSRDADFASLRNTLEFQSIMADVRRQTPPVLNSRLVATIDRRDVFPENIAYDTKRKAFLLGSTVRNVIIRCALGAACVPFVKGSGADQEYILGLKIDRASDGIWATTNSPTGANLRRYNLKSGELERTAWLEGKHIFNDLALSVSGVVYVSDTSEGSVYRLDVQGGKLQRLAREHPFTAANGIALSADENMVYVSVWGNGIEVIDLRSGSVKPVLHPRHISLAFIDGLYALQGSLVAIQNGPMLPRIVQFGLDKSGREIVKMKVLERRNPSFDGVTTGVLVGNQLYYAANPQIDRKNSARQNPLQILAVRVGD